MSGGFFRGTSADQDTRFSNKQAKLLKSQKFAPELDQLVDTGKVKMDVIKPWVANRVTELLGFEDEVLINFIFGLLEGKNVNGKEIQISITGFMEKNTAKFMKELWTLLLSAQKTESGVPQQFLDAKEEEIRKKQAERDRISNQIQKKREKESREIERERSKMDQGVDAYASASTRRTSPDHTHDRDEKDFGNTSHVEGKTRVQRSRFSDHSPSSLRRMSRSVSVSPRRQPVAHYKQRHPRASLSPPKRLSYSRRRSHSSPSQSPSMLYNRPRSPYSHKSRSPLPVHCASALPALHHHKPISPVMHGSTNQPVSHLTDRCMSPAPAPLGMHHKSNFPEHQRSPLPRHQRYPRSPSPRRRRTPSPRWQRSPTPGHLGSPSPRPRRSPLPRRRRSPSPKRQRSPSPRRQRYMSPSHRGPVSSRHQRSPLSRYVGSQLPRRQNSPSPPYGGSPPKHHKPFENCRSPPTLPGHHGSHPKPGLHHTEYSSPGHCRSPSHSNGRPRSPAREEASVSHDRSLPHGSRLSLQHRSPSSNASLNRSGSLSHDAPYHSSQDRSPSPAIRNIEYSTRRQTKSTKEKSGKKANRQSPEVKSSRSYREISNRDLVESERPNNKLQSAVSKHVRRDHRSERGSANEDSRHKKSHRHENSSEESSYDSELEERKESKRRKKEERKTRKEERRHHHEEKRRRKEERRAEKSQTNDHHESFDEEMEYDEQMKLEIELRKKALEILKAKKGIRC